MNQVDMVPNYDEKSDGACMFPTKASLNATEWRRGIGTGFSSVIPSFNHKDLISSIIKYLETGKAKKLKPWVANYTADISVEEWEDYFPMAFEEKDGKVFITELQRL